MATTEPVYSTDSNYSIGFDPIEASNVVAGDFRDPYPELSERRERTPIQKGGFIDEMVNPDGPDLYTVYSCDLVSQVLRDNHRFSDAVVLPPASPTGTSTRLDRTAIDW